MDETNVHEDRAGEPPAPPEPPPRSVPMAAIAGAVILVGLVAFALYRRGITTPSGEPQSPAKADAPAEGSAGEPPKGTVIAAQPPTRLSPEASILAERYRCVCGCNDTLSVCTCRNPNGSEDMKKALKDLVDQRKSPEEVDQAMVERFGPAALLRNPAPPQTLPSHATGGKPPAAPPGK